jgi:transposase
LLLQLFRDNFDLPMREMGEHNIVRSSMAPRRVFTSEFKRKALELLQRGDRSAGEIAQELGIRRNQLYKWQATLGAQGAGAFPGSGRRNGVAEEITRLKRELARVTEERDVLKKAAVFFARESQRHTVP